MKDYDAIIAGGGPAGAATAIALARAGCSVLLVERSRYDRWRIGETLPPEIRLPLTNLGSWDRFRGDAHLPSYGIQAIWGSAEPNETDFIYNPYGVGWHLDRLNFDRTIAADAEQSGATVLRGVCISNAVREQARWRVQINGDEPRSCRSAWLVDATGRSSATAQFLGLRRVISDRMIGVAGLLLPQTRDTTVDPLLLVEAAEQGWWYSAPLPNGSLLITYMTDPDLFNARGRERTAAWQCKLDQTVRTRARATQFRLYGQVRIRPAGTSRVKRAGEPGWIAVGDAAASHDPLSADGIWKALDEGLAAARIIREGGDAVVEYARSASEQFEGYLEQRRDYYRRETRWPESAFWSRRQSFAGSAMTRSAGAD